MIRVRSFRSARIPPTSTNIQKGAFIAKASRPRRNEDPPMLSNSQGSATDCIQVPILEKRLANQKTPNRLVRSSLAVWELLGGIRLRRHDGEIAVAEFSSHRGGFDRFMQRENRIALHRACGRFTLHD